jgi:CheY-like chemotaxis protein
MRNLLLVEDHPDDIYLLTEAFQDLLPDVSIKVAKHGDEAIAYLSGAGVYSNRREYPLPLQVILDLGLPYRSGLEVLEWIRGSRAHSALPVTILSGTQRREDFDHAFALGIEGFFYKPVDFRRLATFLSEPERKRPARPVFRSA